MSAIAADTTQRRRLTLSQPTVLMLGLAVLVAGALWAGQGRIVYYAFTPACLIVGFILYQRYPAQYLAFSLWLWLLSPLVRRIVDWQTTPSTFSPVLLAPLVVSCITGLTIVRLSRHLHEHRYYPFSIILLVLIFALLVGIMTAGPLAAVYAFLSWLGPLGIAYYIMAQPALAPAFDRSAMLTLAFGGVLVGLYGVYQFFYAPEWDTAWMVASEMSSIGNPVAGEIRVFSTLNSPGPLGNVLVACFLAAVSRRGVSGILAPMPIAAALLLSLVRSSWAALPLGVVAMIWVAPRALQRRSFLVVLLAICAAVPIVVSLPAAQVVVARFNTLTNLEDDTSLKVRSAFISTLIDSTFVNPVGRGLGATGLGTRLSTGDGELGQNGIFDSGLLDVFFTFGWGGLILFAGLAAVLLRAWRAARRSVDGSVAVGIAVATLFQMLFVNTMTSGPGMLVLPMVAIAIAQRRPSYKTALPVPATAGG